MFKRMVWILLALAILGVFPALAQQDQPVDAASFVPADFAGFVRVRIGDDPDSALRELNIAAFAASFLAPSRVAAASNPLTYDDFIPVSGLFDTDKVTFTDNIIPWLGSDVVLAYRNFNGGLQADPKDILMIATAKDVFDASSKLSAVIKAQDFPKQEAYRGITIYLGDTSAFAVTSQGVFFGAADMVKAALDIQAGAAARLVDSPLYSPIRDAMPEKYLLSAYISGDYILPALNGLLNGHTDSQPILTAFGAALSHMRAQAGFESRLLDGGFDAAGASISFEDNGATLVASAMFHSSALSLGGQTADFDPSLLDMMPRTAMLVHTGTDAVGLIEDGLAALPVSNFAREILSDWPIQTAGTANPLTPAPNANDIQSAASSYLAALNQFSHFDLQKDLLDYLSGNYAIALIPRPNNPVPVINSPFDTLIVAQSDDAEAAQKGVSTLLQTLFGLQSQTVDPVEGWNFIGVGIGKTTVFRLGTQGHTLLISTGDADQQALRAMTGDNRLVNESFWKDLSKDWRPDLYMDVESVYNAFSLSVGGAAPSDSRRPRLSARLQDNGDGLFQVDLRVLVPI